MITSILCVNFWGILFPLSFICILYAHELNITSFTPWPALFTAFLLSLGLSLIFQRHGCHIHPFYHSHYDHSFSSTVINEPDGNAVNCSTSFGECMKYVKSENFERADIRCSFGEVKVYFDNALIPSGKADIYLDVSFGEAQLFIPKTWKVVNDVHVFLGDMQEKTRNIGSDSPVVTLHGKVSFGDVQIIFI
jgi:predicted membrane protein